MLLKLIKKKNDAVRTDLAHLEFHKKKKKKHCAKQIYNLIALHSSVKIKYVI